MKKKRTKKTLELSKKTVRILTEVDLDRVAGGTTLSNWTTGSYAVVPSRRNC